VGRSIGKNRREWAKIEKKQGTTAKSWTIEVSYKKKQEEKDDK